MSNKVCTMINGREICDEGQALSEMLAEEIIFANGRKYICIDGTVKKETVVLFVNCSDLFSWGCADGEELPYDEIIPLYKAWKSRLWGVNRWCCLRRGERPQKCVEKRMREAGEWDSEMEKLPQLAMELLDK